MSTSQERLQALKERYKNDAAYRESIKARSRNDYHLKKGQPPKKDKRDCQMPGGCPHLAKVKKRGLCAKCYERSRYRLRTVEPFFQRLKLMLRYGTITKEQVMECIEQV